MRVARGDLPLPDPSLHTVGRNVDHRGPNQLNLLQHFGLLPSADVLEIGCGLGRLAYELASYLDDDGSYAGVDVAPAAIDWLSATYAPLLPGFRFDLVDAHNPVFFPEGQADPAQVTLPYDEASFDLVCAFAVFMHLPLPGVARYLAEISRVLRPGGVGVMTFMAIQPGEDEPMHAGRPFVSVGEGIYTRYPERSGVSMGYGVGRIRRLLTDAGLAEVATVTGRWHDRQPAAAGAVVSPADLFVVTRPDR